MLLQILMGYTTECDILFRLTEFSYEKCRETYVGVGVYLACQAPRRVNSVDRESFSLSVFFVLLVSLYNTYRTWMSPRSALVDISEGNSAFELHCPDITKGLARSRNMSGSTSGLHKHKTLFHVFVTIY